MSKKKKYIPLILLIGFAIYNALIIGQGLDEQYHIVQGKITLDYLFSFGEINKDLMYQKYFSTFYWSLLYFITELFPQNYQVESIHLVNLFFSISAIFGIAKIAKELFNKKVAYLVFVILFFYPVFFGHMSINSKDTILAFSHVWIFYTILRYIKKQNIKIKRDKYVISLGLLSALSTGIQLTFLGSLAPIVLFVILDIFFFKKITSNIFSIKKLLFDLIKCFLIFYFVLILFWTNVHPNILVYPFLVFQEFFSSDFVTGWEHNLVNGKYYLSNNVPKLYFLINFVFKSPEYILISYAIFFLIIFQDIIFFKKKFTFFKYKMVLIFLMLIFPSLIIFLIPFPVYDGMRLFLWVLPYFCILPGLTIYYLIENLHLNKSKIFLSILSISFIFHIFVFFSISPYHYTYLNILNGKKEHRYKKFENDYWATSIKELVKKTNFKTDKVIKISTCGFDDPTPREYFKKRLDINYKFVPPDKADYIIMTNRVTKWHGVINCFDKFPGNNIAEVMRNGLILSVIRKI